MKVIDVEGLPEPITRALETVVQALRHQLGAPIAGEKRPAQRVELPRWPGKILGRLSREEIYDRAG